MSTDRTRDIFREKLQERIVKKARDDFERPADLKSEDPLKEYQRRAEVLNKTGSEMSVRDVVLGAQAFIYVKNKIKNSKAE